MDAAQLIVSLELAAPELALALGAMTLLMLGVFAGERSGGFINSLAALLLVAVAGVTAFVTPAAGGEAFNGSFVLDPLARYVKVIVALLAAAALVMSGGYLKREQLARFEYPVLALLAVLGMFMMVSARDLIALYIGIELQSLALYVLAAFNRDSLRASEAGLKYFVLGALSSGLLLYGASLVYGFSGATQFTEIAAAAQAGGEGQIGLIFGLVFLLSGLAFKISAAPFHMWTPDVYEGAPTPVTAFFAAAPKLAAMALIARTLIEPFPGLEDQWAQVVALLAAFSVVIGSYGALVQTNIKRLMAYSSIANMGFALVPLAGAAALASQGGAGASGVDGMLVYMTIYVISTTGVFACILAMRRREGMVEEISDLAGLAKTHPGLAISLTLLLFSIAGIPPLAGFFGKLYAFIPAAEAGLWWLVILALLASVVAAFYYLRLIKVMWMDEPRIALVSAPGELTLIAAGSALMVFPVLLLPMVAGPGREATLRAAASLFVS